MALTRIQAKSGLNTTFASSVASTAFTSPLTNGSIIMVTVEADAGTANSINTPTDTAGNTYTRQKAVNVVATFELEIWTAQNTHTTASNVVTATDTNGGVDSIIIVEEWTGQATTTFTDGTSSNTGSLSPLTAGNIVTTNANDFIWVAGVEAVGASDLTAAAGYSNLTQANTTFSNLGICSQIVAATGTYNGGFTSSVGVSWACASIAIKAVASGAVVVAPTMALMGI